VVVVREGSRAVTPRFTDDAQVGWRAGSEPVMPKITPRE
jgi:hypothetical protein